MLLDEALGMSRGIGRGFATASAKSMGLRLKLFLSWSWLWSWSSVQENRQVARAPRKGDAQCPQLTPGVCSTVPTTQNNRHHSKGCRPDFKSIDPFP